MRSNLYLWEPSSVASRGVKRRTLYEIDALSVDEQTTVGAFLEGNESLWLRTPFRWRGRVAVRPKMGTFNSMIQCTVSMQLRHVPSRSTIYISSMIIRRRTPSLAFPRMNVSNPSVVMYSAASMRSGTVAWNPGL
jgi:hypothetical protein